MMAARGGGRGPGPVVSSEEGAFCSSSNHKAASSSPSPPPRRHKSEFPTKLYAMLQLVDTIPEFSKAVAWLPHGRAFSVLDKDKFMKEVVPVFFNQTKIKSFNRQLHLWGFRRIGRDKQVWYHENFLRGVPAYMERLVRTKIKGNSVDSRDGRHPHFDDMPPLPNCHKEPPDVLYEMEKAVLKMKSSSATQYDLKMPPNENVSDCQTLVSTEPPFQADTSESMTYSYQSRFYEGTIRPVQSPIRVQAKSHACFTSPIKHTGDEDLEPLPFRVDNDYSDLGDDEFANFITGAIRHI
ncbi:hypothetical protein ACHAWT_000107 [Skeletonema menzelii]